MTLELRDWGNQEVQEAVDQAKKLDPHYLNDAIERHGDQMGPLLVIAACMVHKDLCSQMPIFLALAGSDSFDIAYEHLVTTWFDDPENADKIWDIRVKLDQHIKARNN